MIISANSPEDMSNLNSEKQKGLVLIWFYATWCGHCVNMESEWEKLQQNHPEEVSLAKVESEDYNDYEPSDNEDRVQGFPTVRLYHQDKMVKEYDGERSFKHMYDFIQEYINKNPDTKLNNLMIIRGKKTNTHNSKLLHKLKTNQKIAKLKVPKFKRKKQASKKRKRSPSNNNSDKPKKSKKAKKAKKSKKARGRPKGSKNSYPRKRMTRVEKESLSN